MNETKAEGQTLTIVRILDAPLENVWDAWTKPEQFSRWYGAPGHTLLDTVKMDVRAGGEWQATSMMPDGVRYPFAGRYLEADEPARLVFSFENLEDRDNPDTEVVTIELTEVVGKTKMVFTQTGHLPDEVYATGLMNGWIGFIDRLAETVEA
jgi:uncharacterized protein YndB with AHSA1/START domain